MIHICQIASSHTSQPMKSSGHKNDKVWLLFCDTKQTANILLAQAHLVLLY